MMMARLTANVVASVVVISVTNVVLSVDDCCTAFLLSSMPQPPSPSPPPPPPPRLQRTPITIQPHGSSSSSLLSYPTKKKKSYLLSLEASQKNRDSGKVDDDDNDDTESSPTSSKTGNILGTVVQKIVSSSYAAAGAILGIGVQPIVWISLWSVATTGHGLPEGPFGLVGGIEGISYLVVVVLAFKKFLIGGHVNDDNNENVSDGTSISNLSETLSLGTLIVALLVVIKLQIDQGCIPNAKPILDYSSFVRVCK